MKPLLAVQADISKLKYPVFVSPKLDGIRALVSKGKVLSRSLKPIPNKHVQAVLGQMPYEGLDGELIVGPPTAPDAYRRSDSAVMTIEGAPEFTFFAFDFHSESAPFISRYLRLLNYFPNSPIVRVVRQTPVHNEGELLAVEQKYLDQGYEGLMIRHPHGVYKYGRSTVKEGILLKLKRFSDAEAQIIGVEELCSNGNEAGVNELGYTRRSSHKAGLIPRDTLGALVVRNLADGVEFNIGTGFTQEQRKALWASRENLPGRVVKYKSFNIGVKEAPRFPVFLGFRNVIDMEVN